MKLSIEAEHRGSGKIIWLDIGKRSNKSFFSNPSESIDHADLEYIKDRFPLITTNAKADIFKRLYKNLFIKVSEDQLEEMQHAIGLNYKKKPYRNRFFCSENDKNWNELVEKGLAMKGTKRPNNDDNCYFWLTHQGVEFVLNRSVSNKVYDEL